MVNYDDRNDGYITHPSKRGYRARKVEDVMTNDINPKDLVGVLKAPLGLVPPALVIETAPALANGAKKYGAYNWRTKAVKLSVYLEAAQRHLLAAQDGEEVAPDSGIDHLSHAAACLAIIFDARAMGKLVYDLPPPGPAGVLLARQDRSKFQGNRIIEEIVTPLDHERLMEGTESFVPDGL